MTLHILGGGPAGLAAAHYAHARGLPFTLFEAGTETGGNCRTLAIGPCLYDTGAHRLHARDPEAAALFRLLLGDELVLVNAPSRIVRGGTTFRFPPEPRDLLRHLSARETARVVRDLLRATIFRRSRMTYPGTFHDFAIARYGRTIAELFLLGYTRKLWGRDPRALSTAVAGGRLDGLNLRTAALHSLGKAFGRASPARAPHLDGTFLYPKRGIVSLFRAVEKGFPDGAVRVKTRVTRIRHGAGRIQAITLNDGEEQSVENVISTLPLPAFVRALDPLPPADILARASHVVFRNLVLCVFHLQTDRFTDNASLYFPDPDIPFTRLYEPKNRSAAMSPPGETCLVLEIPCDPGDTIWHREDADIAHRSLEALRKVMKATDARWGPVLDCKVERIPQAYPVLAAGIEADVDILLDYCRSFSNLRLAGRNALFRYAHIHDMFRQGREAVDALSRALSPGDARATSHTAE